MLLSAGKRLENDSQLATLLEQPLFVDETETANWKRRVQVALDVKLRGGATLGELAEAVPAPVLPEAAARRELPLGELWDMLVNQLDTVLRDIGPHTEWQPRLLQVRERARQLLARRTDASLYCLVHAAGSSSVKYSSRHAMLVTVICQLSGQLLDWPEERVDVLTLAALTMNMSMLRLQDRLAQTTIEPTPAERASIEDHPEASARCLQDAGLDDALCLEAVRRHHQASQLDKPLAELPPAEQLAQLLRRVDIFVAKISCRATRQALSPMQAAREAVLGANGTPDEIGSALLRAAGLYPPGSFVELLNGELAIVLARGRRANLPVVASLVSSSGEVLLQPLLRDSIERRFAVKTALRPDAVRVRPPHAVLLAMR